MRAQASAALNLASSGVPVFSTSASLAREMSAISSTAWAMMGLAPTASATLAQSLAVTIFEMQCMSGRFARQLAQSFEVRHYWRSGRACAASA